MSSIAARQATHAWILLVLLTVLSRIAGYASAGGLVGSGVVLVAAIAKGQ